MGRDCNPNLHTQTTFDRPTRFHPEHSHHPADVSTTQRRTATPFSCVDGAANRPLGGGNNHLVPGGARLENAWVPRPPALLVRQLTAADRPWVRATLVRNWSSTTVARRGELIEARGLAGFVALLGGRRTGLVLVNLRDDDLEVVAISTNSHRRGVGHALMKQCFEHARECGCRRVWLITTNNNATAIAFYQRVGMRVSAYHRNAVQVSRLLEPSIPMRDSAGVPIDHELEFELPLDRDSSD